MERNGRCAICGSGLNGRVYGMYKSRDVSELVPRVCTWECLSEYITTTAKRIINTDMFIKNKHTNPFASELEELVYNRLTELGHTLLYEPYHIQYGHRGIYVPDFLIDYSLFLEVKGVGSRIHKVSKFKEYADIIMLTAPVIEYLEGYDRER